MSNITKTLWENGTNRILQDFQIKRLFYGYLRKVGNESSMDEEDRLLEITEPGDYMTDINDWHIGGNGGIISPIAHKYTEEDMIYLTGGYLSFNIHSNKEEERQFKQDIKNLKIKLKKACKIT